MPIFPLNRSVHWLVRSREKLMSAEPGVILNLRKTLQSARGNRALIIAKQRRRGTRWQYQLTN